MSKRPTPLNIEEINKGDGENTKIMDKNKKLNVELEKTKIKKIPISIIFVMILLFLFTIYVHIIKPVTTILEIIYLARMTKANKLDNAEYYDKALNHFITELNGLYKNQEKFQCFTFDLETGEADVNQRCDSQPSKTKQVNDTITDIVKGFTRYFNVLEDLEKRLDTKKLNEEKAVVTEGLKHIRSIHEDGQHTGNDNQAHLTFYKRLVVLKDYFEEIRDKIITKNVKKSLIFVGWIFVFVLPIPTYILFGVPTIYYQESVWASIWSTIVSLVEVFMNIPLAFLYPDAASSVFIVKTRGFEHLLANWLIFFPTSYLTNLYENIRQIAESALLLSLCFKSYNRIKDNYFENFTESFILIIIVFNIMRIFCSIILIVIGIWKWCKERDYLILKVKEQREANEKEEKEKNEKEKAANEASSQGDKPVETVKDKKKD